MMIEIQDQSCVNTITWEAHTQLLGVSTCFCVRQMCRTYGTTLKHHPFFSFPSEIEQMRYVYGVDGHQIHLQAAYMFKKVAHGASLV